MNAKAWADRIILAILPNEHVTPAQRQALEVSLSALIGEVEAERGDEVQRLRVEREFLEGRVRQVLEANTAEVERRRQAERASRTRPDYDIRCQDCGAPHNLELSIARSALSLPESEATA